MSRSHYWSPSEIGDHLKIATRDVETMIKQGVLPSRRLPTGAIVVDAEEFSQWCESLPTGAEAETLED